MCGILSSLRVTCGGPLETDSFMWGRRDQEAPSRVVTHISDTDEQCCTAHSSSCRHSSGDIENTEV